ncbi:MAG: hypothetical protein KatS3mg105_4874 [Gemmatales bacterium]|nr:MAG: hypothetical protein KatS3mg105_4874 [Gemmatales bacterium]
MKAGSISRHRRFDSRPTGNETSRIESIAIQGPSFQTILVVVGALLDCIGEVLPVGTANEKGGDGDFLRGKYKIGAFALGPRLAYFWANVIEVDGQNGSQQVFQIALVLDAERRPIFLANAKLANDSAQPPQQKFQYGGWTRRHRLRWLG